MNKIAFSFLIIVISLIVLAVGLVLMIISIKKTNRGKKKFIAGIITGIILGITGLFVLFSGAISILTIGLSKGVEVLDSYGFHPADDSPSISGQMLVFGEEIKLPCTIGELKSMGYDTDYIYFNGKVSMVRADGESSKISLQVCTDYNIRYESNQKLTDEDKIVAYKFTSDYPVEFEFNDIEFGMTEEEFIKRFGEPAFKIEDSFFGDSLYYAGDNDLAYRFNFTSGQSHELDGIMAGTAEYMTWESQGLYHT